MNKTDVIHVIQSELKKHAAPIPFLSTKKKEDKETKQDIVEKNIVVDTIVNVTYVLELLSHACQVISTIQNISEQENTLDTRIQVVLDSVIGFINENITMSPNEQYLYVTWVKQNGSSIIQHILSLLQGKYKISTALQPLKNCFKCCF